MDAAAADSSGAILLVDGYNVIKLHPLWRTWSLLRARMQFVAHLAEARWPVPVARIHVIFDGTGLAHDAARVHPRLWIQFAPSADDVIRQLIHTAMRTDRLLVISDDRAILRTAKSCGASTHSASWLLARLQPPSPRPVEAGAESRLPSRAEIERINAELAIRWGITPATTRNRS